MPKKPGNSNHASSQDNSGEGLTVELSLPVLDERIFARKATDDILKFLAEHPYDQYSIQDLVDVLPVSREGIRRALDVLEGNDLVRSNRVENKRLVQINTERLHAPDDPVLKIPQTEFHEPVRRAVNELKKRLDGLSGIVLYGSVARGEADRQSDIDLWVLVEADRAKNQRRANEIAKDLAEKEVGGERYNYHMAVESTDSVPAFTEDISKIIAAGMILYAEPKFNQFTTILSDVTSDE